MLDRSGLGVMHFILMVSPLGVRSSLMQALRKFAWVDMLMKETLSILNLFLLSRSFKSIGDLTALKVGLLLGLGFLDSCGLAE